MDWDQADLTSKQLRQEFIASLTDRFIELQSLKSHLISRVEKETLSCLQTLCHRLAGVGGSYGFSTLSEIAGALDDYLLQDFTQLKSEWWNLGIDLLGIALMWVVQNQRDPGHLLQEVQTREFISFVEGLLSPAKP